MVWKVATLTVDDASFVGGEESANFALSNSVVLVILALTE